MIADFQPPRGDASGNDTPCIELVHVLHRQPERVVRISLEQLRSNWEVASEVEAVFK